MAYNTYDMDIKPAELIGGFTVRKNEDFKNGIKAMCESMISDYNYDPFTNISQILQNESVREAYKDKLIGDVLESVIDDEYFSQHIQKLDQLFENSSYEILAESAAVGQMSPIVGTTLPILKKNYLDSVAKDIVLTEVPNTPLIVKSFERKFLKDKAGNKFYIPEIFYDEKYQNVMNQTKGNPLPSSFLPDTEDESAGIAMPLHDYNLLAKAGGSLEKRDSLSLNLAIEAVKIKVSEGDIREIALDNCVPNLGADNTFYKAITVQDTNGSVLASDAIMGRVDFYSGKVSISATAGKITHIKFRGNLSNENNVNTLELDREREHVRWQIGDGERLNSGLTIERLRDYKVLLNIDLATSNIADMSDVLTQSEDSNILKFVKDSYGRWKDKTSLPFGYEGGFTSEAKFSCVAPSTISIPGSVWLNSEIKFNLARFIDNLKTKLKEEDIMFVIAGHPNNVTLLNENVNWVIDDKTKVGGVEFNYSFGVLTDSKDRAHVISSMKIPQTEGLWVIAYPLSDKTMTFKHFKYSMNIENSYRNPLTPLTPNVMATSRYETVELLPVQGRFLITDNDFGITKR